MSNDDYKQGRLNDLNVLCDSLKKTEELRSVLDDPWRKRVELAIGRDEGFSSSAFYLFDILSSYPGGGAISMSPADLEERLVRLRDRAVQQNKKALYRDTRQKLGAPQENQVLGALFEIIVLSDLLGALQTVELYPPTDSRKAKSNVDARAKIEDRWVYLEVKALGYSKYDLKGKSGVGSIESMKRQVTIALQSKLGEGGQLATLAQHHPTVLALALGFFAGIDSATGAIDDDDFRTEATQNVSCIFVAESAFVNKGMKPFPNTQSLFQLTCGELAFFKRVLRSDQHAKYRTKLKGNGRGNV